VPGSDWKKEKDEDEEADIMIQQQRGKRAGKAAAPVY